MQTTWKPNDQSIYPLNKIRPPDQNIISESIIFIVTQATNNHCLNEANLSESKIMMRLAQVNSNFLLVVWFTGSGGGKNACSLKIIVIRTFWGVSLSLSLSSH